MVVGVCRLRLSIEGNDSLKGKRAPLRSIIDRVRSRFNAAVAEVAAQDELRLGVLGFAVVSNDASHVHQMLERIVSFIDREGDLPIVGRETELVHLGSALQEERAEISGDWADYEADDGDAEER